MTQSDSQPDSLVLSAAAMLPDCRELLFNSAVAVVNGVIQAHGDRADIRRRYSGLPEVHVDNCVLMPGFVNAHCHLELSFLAGRIPGPAHFPDWVLQLIAAYPSAADAPDVFAASAVLGSQECIRFGTTTVGDISRQHAIVRPALRAASPLGVVSFGEVTGLGRSRGQLEARLAAAMDCQSTDQCSIGLSPHAPYSVEGPALKEIADMARRYRLPLAMHLAELQEERDFLRDFSGPLGRNWMLMKRLDLLDDRVPIFADGPIRWAQHYGLFSAGVPVVLAHVNYADDTDLDILAASGAAVAYCPRTRHYFGHDDVAPHPWQDMRTRGIKVCLATDSMASNPDLSLLREAQFVRQRFPGFDPQALIEMITTEPATALGLGRKIGRLAPGFAADIIAMPAPESALTSAASFADYLVQEAPSPHQVWIRGRGVSRASI